MAVCIISGLPGIGKTTLARMLLLYFYNKDFNVVKIESDISEARAVGYHSKPRFYYYDDFLGQTAQADKLNKNEDQKLLDFMASIRDSKDSLLILTTREYILNQARLHYEKLARERFDHRTCTIDLSKYSRRIRAQILYNHLHFSDLPRTHLEALVAERGYVKIVDHKNYNPRLIEYLTNSAWVGHTPPTEYGALFLRNLENPVEIWGHAFRRQLSDRARHLLFVLPTLPTESRMADAERAFTAFHTTQCDRSGIAHRATDFRDALKELDGTFVGYTLRLVGGGRECCDWYCPRLSNQPCTVLHRVCRTPSGFAKPHPAPYGDASGMNDRIVIDPKVCHGKPVVRGTRMPVSLIVGSLAGGMSFEDVQREYALTLEDIRAALKFAGELVEQEQYHPLPG